MKNKGGLEAKLANKMFIQSKRVSRTQCFLRRQNFQTKPSRLSIMSTIQEEDSSVSPMQSKIDEGENIRYTSNDIILINTAMKNLMKNKRVLEAKLANKRAIESKRVSTTQCYLRRQNFPTMPSKLSIMTTIQEEDSSESPMPSKKHEG